MGVFLDFLDHDGLHPTVLPVIITSRVWIMPEAGDSKLLPRGALPDAIVGGG